MSLCKIQVIGNLTKDALVNDVNGKKVVNFGIAVNEKYKDANGTEVNKAKFFDCAYWSDKTAVAQYIKKGDLIYVEGNPEIKYYRNKEGQQLATFSVRVSNIQLLGSSDKQQPQSQPSYAQVTQGATIASDGDNDVPF